MPHLRSLLPLALCFAMPVGTAACGGDDDDDDDDVGDGDADADGDGDGDGDGDADGDGDGDADGDADCSDRPGDAAPARGDHVMVVDETRNRLIVFGGDVNPPSQCIPSPEYDDTTWAFELDCDNWRQLDATGPSPRARMSVALDTTRDKMVIFGGRFRAGGSGPYTQYDEVWSFDLATDTWEAVVTDVGPSARVNSSLVYDAPRDRFILFGGNTSTSGLSFTPQNDTWALSADGGEWTRIAQSGAPDAREFHSASITSDGTRMIVLAGGDENAFVGPFFYDVWALDLESDTWSELSSMDPDSRISAGLGSGGGAMVLFGGHDDGALGNRNDLWLVDDSGDDLVWDSITLGDQIDQGGAGFCDFPVDFATVDPTIPERRSAGGFAVDSNGIAYVFGGKTDCGITNDVWSWDAEAAAWTERFPASGGVGLSCLRTGRQDCVSHCF